MAILGISESWNFAQLINQILSKWKIQLTSPNVINPTI
jgi:hypothetical protein